MSGPLSLQSSSEVIHPFTACVATASLGIKAGIKSRWMEDLSLFSGVVEHWFNEKRLMCFYFAKQFQNPFFQVWSYYIYTLKKMRKITEKCYFKWFHATPEILSFLVLTLWHHRSFKRVINKQLNTELAVHV